MMLRCHRVLDGFELGRKELDDAATLRTDHVIVMLMFVIVFVVRTSIAKAHLAREAGFSQQFERTIDGGLADGRVFFFDELVEGFVREVLFSAQKNIQNQVALRRALEAFLPDVFKEDFLLFGQWLFGRRHGRKDFTTRRSVTKE